LVENDVVVARNGGARRVVSVERLKGRQTVYNLEVHGEHVYLVSPAAILVHNDSFADLWNSIKPTQPVYDGTVIPRSFELTTQNGRFWVHGNATEHLAEFASGATRRGLSPELVNLSTTVQLASLQAAVNAAAQRGIPYHTMLQVAGWELIFAPPRNPGELPAIIHALYTGS
jgi:hypothetical protein